jgi:hypothetical protein
MAGKVDIELNEQAANTIDHEKNQVETVHNDEAVKVIASYDGDLAWSEQEEKALVKTIDRRLMPILILTYGLQYYDKAMLSQAVRRPSVEHRSHLICCYSRQYSAFEKILTLRLGLATASPPPYSILDSFAARVSSPHHAPGTENVSRSSMVVER